jgi:hypothetical protein
VGQWDPDVGVPGDAGGGPRLRLELHGRRRGIRDLQETRHNAVVDHEVQVLIAPERPRRARDTEQFGREIGGCLQRDLGRWGLDERFDLWHI